MAEPHLQTVSDDTPTAAADPRAAYARRFAAAGPTLPGAGHGWLRDLRARAMAAFEAEGFPTRRAEEWKYTELKPAAALAPVPAPETDRLPEALAEELAAIGAAPHRLVLVNGRFRPDLSRLDGLPAGVRLLPLAQALEAGDPLLEAHLAGDEAFAGRPARALTTALMADGALLHVAAGVDCAEPIQILCLTDAEAPAGATVHPRLLAVLEENSHAVLVETFASAGNALVAPVVDIVVGAGARLAHYRRQEEGAGVVHLADGVVRLGRDATYDGFTLALGSALARTELHADLAGPGGFCRLAGLYLGDGKQVLDTTTRVTHSAPDCLSRQVHKGVLDGQARGVFQGKVLVVREAQRTDGYQSHKALMLSRKAEIDAKPELEIYADDVKCSHGATAGELDSDALFYLRARGIDEATARAMMVEAFLLDGLEEIPDEPVRTLFAHRLAVHLDRRLNAGGAVARLEEVA